MRMHVSLFIVAYITFCHITHNAKLMHNLCAVIGTQACKLFGLFSIIHINKNVHVHMCVHVHKYMYIWIKVHTCVQKHMKIFIYVCIWTHLLCICDQMHLGTCVYVNVDMCINIACVH